MFNKIRAWTIANRKVIVITFELFWLVVFLLDRVSNVNSVEIPQFIYERF
jgi:hypothetical protein